MATCKVELKDYTVHLGAHGSPLSCDHRFSAPEEGVHGLQLPFQVFSAVSLEAAKEVIERLNGFADAHNLDCMALSKLLGIVDMATGS